MIFWFFWKLKKSSLQWFCWVNKIRCSVQTDFTPKCFKVNNYLHASSLLNSLFHCSCSMWTRRASRWTRCVPSVLTFVEDCNIFILSIFSTGTSRVRMYCCLDHPPLDRPSSVTLDWPEWDWSLPHSQVDGKDHYSIIACLLWLCMVCRWKSLARITCTLSVTWPMI